MKELHILESDKNGILKRLKVNKEKTNELNFVTKKRLGQDCSYLLGLLLRRYLRLIYKDF